MLTKPPRQRVAGRNPDPDVSGDPLPHGGFRSDRVHVTSPCPQTSLTAFAESPSTQGPIGNVGGGGAHGAFPCSPPNSNCTETTEKKPAHHVSFLIVDFLHFFMHWERMKMIFDFKYICTVSFPFSIRKGRGVALTSDEDAAGIAVGTSWPQGWSAVTGCGPGWDTHRDRVPCAPRVDSLRHENLPDVCLQRSSPLSPTIKENEYLQILPFPNYLRQVE